MIFAAVFINLRNRDSRKLTHDPLQLKFGRKYRGAYDDILVFANAAHQAGLGMHVVNTNEFGYILPLQTTTADDDMAHLEFLLLNSLEYGLPGLLPSSVLEPKFRPPTKLGFDQIYLVNLDRRPDRKERSEALFRILGIKATRISAVDGRNIDQQYIDDVGINFLPNYSDPYYERPMTRGEIGCFMSHYHIWQDVVENGYKQVILFEDDLQFAIDARRKLLRLRDEIEERKLEYDLLYIGRKRLSDEEEIKNTHYLEGSRLIATVGYTYWTLGYLLTQSGARKLIDAKPLKNLLPVDEYLPVMFDKHPTEDWYRHFPDRNLIAFTTEPLIVEPVLYRGEEGYVSDTEESLLAFGDEKGRKKAFMPGDQHLDDANRGDQQKTTARKTEL